MQEVLNVAFSFGIIFLSIWIIKDFWACKFAHFKRTNVIRFCLLILIFLCACFLQAKGFVEIYCPVVVGDIVFFVILCVIVQGSEKKKVRSAEHICREERKLCVEKIDRAKLKSLLLSCQEDGMDITEKNCDCYCRFSSHQEAGASCLYEMKRTCEDTFFCGGAHCMVFKTIVDFRNGSKWCEQDMVCAKRKLRNRLLGKGGGRNFQRKCLLSKVKTNEELRVLVEEVQKEL